MYALTSKINDGFSIAYNLKKISIDRNDFIRFEEGCYFYFYTSEAPRKIDLLTVPSNIRNELRNMVRTEFFNSEDFKKRGK